MTKLKPGKPEEPDSRIEDPAFLRQAMQALFDAETEFPIKVEGTSTLPYFSSVRNLSWDEGFLVLKLVRPLPHELMVGAVFHFLCASGEQRFEGYLTFAGREGYLQYRFETPKYLILSDRRNTRRYPFRPRESAYVIAQDSGIPGLGVAGPLVNICMGGLAMRVDRVIRLDTGYRIPPTTALFDRGKGLQRIRVQDLPRVHLLEVRGITAHALERGDEIILGISFSPLKAEEEALLRTTLEVRDRMQRGQAGGRIEGGAVALRSGDSQGLLPDEVLEAQAAPDQEGELLKRLRRRTAVLALVMPEGPLRQPLEDRLRESGFHRLLLTETMEQLATLVGATPRRQLPHLCIVDLAVAHVGDAEPLEAVRSIENHVAGIGAIPTVILCEAVDPTLLLAQAEQTRFLPPDLTPEALATLDALLDKDLA